MSRISEVNRVIYTYKNYSKCSFSFTFQKIVHLSHIGLVFAIHDLHSRSPCMLKPSTKFAHFQRPPCITIDERHRLVGLTYM